MEKKICLVVVSLLISLTILSGCEEEVATVKTFDNIIFESNIIELYNASLEVRKKHDVIRSAEVTFYFRNNLDKEIDNLDLGINFYDASNNILHTHFYSYLTPFPAGYMERSPNKYTYNEPNVIYLDHVEIRVLNYTIAE